MNWINYNNAIKWNAKSRPRHIHLFDGFVSPIIAIIAVIVVDIPATLFVCVVSYSSIIRYIHFISNVLFYCSPLMIFRFSQRCNNCFSHGIFFVCVCGVFVCRLSVTNEWKQTMLTTYVLSFINDIALFLLCVRDLSSTLSLSHSLCLCAIF